MKKKIKITGILLFFTTSLFAEDVTNSFALKNFIEKNAGPIADIILHNIGFIVAIVFITLLVNFLVNRVKPKYLDKYSEKIKNYLSIIILVVAFSALVYFALDKIDLSIFMKVVCSVFFPSTPLMKTSVVNEEISIDARKSNHSIIQIKNTIDGDSTNTSNSGTISNVGNS